MRVLYHHRTLADGAEGIHIDEMVKAFRDLGHEVRVAGPAAVAGADGRTRAVQSVRSRMPRALFELGSAGYNVPEYVQMRRVIEQFRPDFLYKRHARNDLAALAAARTRGVSSVLEVNCLYTDPGYLRFEPVSLPRLARALERRALESATVVLAVSTPLAQQIARMSRVRPVVMPNAVDPDRFHPRRAHPAAVRGRYHLGSSFVVGWAGILREWHGLELLLAALTTLDGAILLVVGDGPARPTLERRAAELGIADRIVITGRVAHDMMPDHIAAMDVAVVADERTGVASPMKLLEYMAMARPVVAPRIGGVLDVIDDGKEGLLFNAGESEALATVLSRLASDPALRDTLGRRARLAIEQSRSWSRNAEAVLAAVCPPRGEGAG